MCSRMPALVALWVSIALLCGCIRGEPPAALLNVADFAPRHAEVGDRLEVVGSGFPEGKTATLSFVGDLHRPGQEPVRDVEIVVAAANASANRISAVLSEELQARFCGRGDRADHTTFRGEVVAAFAAKMPGAPPVTGTVRDVVFSIQGPPSSPEIAREREAEGRLALEFLGVELAPHGSSGALAISAIVQGGRADRAGLEVGDVLTSVDGVNVRGVSDVGFSGAERLATVAVRRGKLRETIERKIDVQGFRTAAPRELGTAAVLIGVVVLLFVFSMLPTARVFAFVERRVALRVREHREARRTPPVGGSAALRRKQKMARFHRALGDELVPSGDPFVLRLIPYLTFVAVSAMTTLVTFGRPLVAVDLDLPLALLGSTTALIAAALISGGWRSAGRWSLLSGLKQALVTFAMQLPLLAAFACVALAAGSVRFADIVSEQGVFPWQYNAFKSPVGFLSLALLLAASIPDVTRRDAELAEADLSVPAPGGLMFYVGHCHLLVVSSLAALVLLGGWQLPGGARPSVGQQALAAFVVQLKCWGVLGAIVFLRWALPRVRADQMTNFLWRFLLPAAALGLVGSVAWASWLRKPAVAAAEPVLGYVIFGLAVLGASKFGASVWAHVRAESAPMHVNPWL